MKKERLDKLLVDKGFCSSRNEAQKLILADSVKVEGFNNLKAGLKIPIESKIRVKTKPKFVSAGGIKLEKAIKEFNIMVKNKICLDIGASTGGFTDCLLQYGAKIVYALDVGYGQLAWKIRTDNRVKVYEKTNFRKLKEHFFDTKFDIIVMDVSFISISLLFENVSLNLKDNGIFLPLIKPQFEAGVDKVEKGGIVKEKNVFIQIITTLKQKGVKHSLYLKNIVTIPQVQKRKNMEFMAMFSKVPDNILNEETINNIIDKSYELWFEK